MKRSTDRILTTHVGSLPRPDDVRAMVAARSWGQPYDAETLSQRLREAVAEIVRKQVECGIDVVNDGELSKTNFTAYVRERVSGWEPQEPGPDALPWNISISGREMAEFSEYLLARSAALRNNPDAMRAFVCTGPLKYVGHAAVQADIENLKAALQGVQVEEAFLTAVAPGTIEHWLRNAYYASDEEMVYAIAEAMREEYEAIVNAGFILQIDDPDLATGWQIHTEMSLPEYRKFAEVRIDALNYALRNIPEDRVRIHMCWGSFHGPHTGDIPLRDIVDLILKVRATAYLLEAANPRHEHEWKVWEEVKLPEGKVLVPGAVGHASDFVEHPELVAERLVKYARLVGRENVMAGTDCGLGGRVGHPSIVWAKFRALAEGARLATQQLWG